MDVLTMPKLGHGALFNRPSGVLSPSALRSTEREKFIAELKIRYPDDWQDRVKEMDDIATAWKKQGVLQQSVYATNHSKIIAVKSILDTVSIWFQPKCILALICFYFLHKNFEQTLVTAIKGLFKPEEDQSDLQRLFECYEAAGTNKEDLLFLYRLAFTPEVIQKLTPEAKGLALSA